MMASTIDVLLQPLGRTIDLVEAPLAKYQPEIIVLFTNMSGQVDLVEGHLKNNWRKYTKHPPLIITKHIGEPWRAETIAEYMHEFNEVVDEISSMDIAKGKDITWHVGTTGGTNLMGIAAALSAFTHRFPAFYTLPKEKYPEIADTPGELVIELPLFSNLGPAFKALTKKPRTLKIMRFIVEKGPVNVHSITEMLEGTTQNTSAGMIPLKTHDLIVESEQGFWVPTILGRTLMAQIEPSA